MKLYEFGPTRSILARWMLQELGVDFEAISVDMSRREHCSPSFLALNPAGKVPVLADGGLVLSESIAIVLYLAEKYPEGGLIPTELQVRADFYRWILFVVTELEQPWWRMVRHTNIYPEQDRLPADIDLARRDFQTMAAVMEKHMQGREFVAGGRMTAADIVLAYHLDVANELHLLGDCPALRAHLERMYARPRAPERVAVLWQAVQTGEVSSQQAEA